MLTQCPSCQTTFRVTSEILRVAHGQVRCGRCQTQFDALERLIEENDAGDVESGRYMRPPRSIPQPPEPSGQIEVEEPVEHEQITLEGRHIEISGVYETIDESGQGQPQIREQTVEEWVEIDQDDALLDSEPEVEVIDMREEYSSVVEEDADIQAAAAEMEAERAASQSGQWAQPEPQPQVNITPTRTREPSVRSRRNPRAITVDDSPTEFDFPTQQHTDSPSPLWSLLAVPLVLGLLVQVVHHYRADLARHPQLGGPMQSIYSALGLSLRPDWNLHAYEVRQWGVIADPSAPGTLKVRASVKNLADFPQPYPLLKLVLEDRWGDQVRAREFEPAEYLDPSAAPNRMLAPAQQTNASIAIVDPGPDAEGFRFDVCLRGARGAVCAADVPGKL